MKPAHARAAAFRARRPQAKTSAIPRSAAASPARATNRATAVRNVSAPFTVAAALPGGTARITQPRRLPPSSRAHTALRVNVPDPATPVNDSTFASGKFSASVRLNRARNVSTLTRLGVRGPSVLINSSREGDCAQTAALRKQFAAANAPARARFAAPDSARQTTNAPASFFRRISAHSANPKARRANGHPHALLRIRRIPSRRAFFRFRANRFWLEGKVELRRARTLARSPFV